MSALDTAFLDEVEDFLTKCDVPVLPCMQLLDGDDKLPASPTQPDMFVEFEVQLSDAALEPLPVDFSPLQMELAEDAPAEHDANKAKDRQRRAMYRAKRRQERDSLRQQVGELTTALIKQQRARDLGKLPPSMTWKMVAERQMQARMSAEAQQRRLAAAVAARATLLQQFRGMVFDRPAHGDGTLMAALEQNQPIPQEPSDAEMFAEYLRSLEEIHAQIDKVFGSVAVDCLGETKWVEAGEDGYFQFVEEHVQPNAVHETHEAMWQTTYFSHRQASHEHFSGMDDVDNTVALKFRLTTRLKSGKTATALQRLVTRRFISDERLVIVWRASIDGEGMFAGLHADETGWNVCTPVADSEEPAALVKTCVRNVPMHFRSAADVNHVLKQFADLVLDSNKGNCAVARRALERLQMKVETV